MNFRHTLLACTMSLLAYNTAAIAANDTHIVVAPTCLIKQMATTPLASTKEFVLLNVNSAGIDQLIQAKANRKTLCGGFVDVTAQYDAYSAKQLSGNKAQAFLSDYTKPQQHKSAKLKPTYTIKHEKEVAAIYAKINPTQMWDYLTTLTSFKDRYSNSDTGVKAAEWFKSEIETIAKNNNRNDVTVTLINTGTRYKQPSVLVKLGTSNEPGIVIGAHMDTLSASRENKPGADDDGSGSVCVLETARALISSGMQFKKPIYFAWYAAEEQGLVGSGYVISEFQKKNIPVDAVMHFDLTGYAYNNEPTMWLMDDYVDRDLAAYFETLIKTYVKQPVKHSRCGYACSDHANWTKAGYVTAFPAEAAYEDSNPYMHSASDTMDKLSLSHMTDYLKLATAFAVEMADPTTYSN